MALWYNGLMDQFLHFSPLIEQTLADGGAVVAPGEHSHYPWAPLSAECGDGAGYGSGCGLRWSRAGNHRHSGRQGNHWAFMTR